MSYQWLVRAFCCCQISGWEGLSTAVRIKDIRGAKGRRGHVLEYDNIIIYRSIIVLMTFLSVPLRITKDTIEVSKHIETL